MSYQRGFLNRRISVMNRTASTDGQFGRTGGEYQHDVTIWANVSFTRGQKAMREGAIDAYDYFMIRCDCHSELREDSHLHFDGHEYQIESFHADPSVNECQLTCVRLQK